MKFLATLLAASLLALGAPARAQTLVGRAILPADTFSYGPTSGQFIEPSNGRTPPFVNQQPEGGFSSLQSAPDGDFYALCDNGFGTKANSADFVLRIYRLSRDLQTAKGGSGMMKAKSFIPLSDPQHNAPFPLVADQEMLTLPNGGQVKVAPAIQEGRLLTGADFDPESFVRASDGSFWVSDEFGPFLLHFDATGMLLEAPFALEGVASPDDPLKHPATIDRSKGFEGLARSADGQRLYAMLEGVVKGDDPRRLRISEFDLRTKSWTGRQFTYYLEPSDAAPKQHSIGEIAWLSGTRFLVIERDSLEGDAATFKRVYQIDLAKRDKNGDVSKRLVLDLLRLNDPARLSGFATFRFSFQTIESVLPLGGGKLALINDNNYPFSAGRKKGEPENSELIIVQLDPQPRG